VATPLFTHKNKTTPKSIEGCREGATRAKNESERELRKREEERKRGYQGQQPCCHVQQSVRVMGFEFE